MGKDITAERISVDVKEMGAADEQMRELFGNIVV